MNGRDGEMGGWLDGWIERGGPWLEGLLLKEMVAAAQQVAVDGA